MMSWFRRSSTDPDNVSPITLSVGTLGDFLQSTASSAELDSSTSHRGLGHIIRDSKNTVSVVYTWSTDYGLISVNGMIYGLNAPDTTCKLYASCDNNDMPLFITHTMSGTYEEAMVSLRTQAKGIVESLEYGEESFDDGLEELGFQIGEAMVTVGSIMYGYVKGIN